MLESLFAGVGDGAVLSLFSRLFPLLCEITEKNLTHKRYIDYVDLYSKVMYSSALMKHSQVDAAPVHLANGVWGILAAGLFATEEGYSASYYAERSHR